MEVINPVKKYSSELAWSYISVPLTQAANNYASGQTLIAPLVMPFFPAPFGSGIMPGIGRGDFQASDLTVEPATECKQHQFNLDRGPFLVERRAIKTALDEALEHDSAEAWRWRENVTIGLTGILNASSEKRVWDAVGSASNVSSTWTVKSAFTGAGDAMTAVSGLLDGIQGIGGFRPDLVSFGKNAWGSFAANSAVIARCGGWVTPTRVAEVFRVNTVAVHDGQYNSESDLPSMFTSFQTTDSISAFCTKGPRWGIRPYWVPPGFSGGPLYTEHYADEKARCSFIEVGCWTKEVVADANLAGTLFGVNSSQAGGL